MKDVFMYSEIWILTTMGGFQRANLYDKNFNPNEVERKNFRDALQTYIQDLSLTQYINSIDAITHLNNIKSISEFTATSKFSYLLKNGQLNFGVSQKLLNLYLKYLWCMNAIKTPPHFPVDRIIQETLNKEATNLGMKKRKITSWTQMVNESEYMDVIHFANEVLINSNFKNLAELELKLFERN